jgi:hypothetical protein
MTYHDLFDGAKYGGQKHTHAPSAAAPRAEARPAVIARQRVTHAAAGGMLDPHRKVDYS